MLDQPVAQSVVQLVGCKRNMPYLQLESNAQQVWTYLLNRRTAHLIHPHSARLIDACTLSAVRLEYRNL